MLGTRWVLPFLLSPLLALTWVCLLVFAVPSLLPPLPPPPAGSQHAAISSLGFQMSYLPSSLDWLLPFGDKSFFLFHFILRESLLASSF